MSSQAPTENAPDVYGTIYTRPDNPRTIAIRCVAHADNIKLQFKTVEGASTCGPEYLSLNPLGKVPTFIRHSDNFLLTECIAIAVFFAEQNPNATLLGTIPEERATILRWMSFINADVYDCLGGWFLPLIGRRPYNKASVEHHMQLSERRLGMIEQQLAKTRFLAGERLTLADLFGTGMLAAGFQCFFGREWREKHPNFTRWAKEVYESDLYQVVAKGKELVMIEKAIPNEPVKNPERFAR